MWLISISLRKKSERKRRTTLCEANKKKPNNEWNGEKEKKKNHTQLCHQIDYALQIRECR